MGVCERTIVCAGLWIGVRVCRCRHGKCRLGTRIGTQTCEQVCASIHSVAHVGHPSTPCATQGLPPSFFLHRVPLLPEKRATCSHLSEGYGLSSLPVFPRPPLLTPPTPCFAKAAVPDGEFAGGSCCFGLPWLFGSDFARAIGRELASGREAGGSDQHHGRDGEQDQRRQGLSLLNFAFGHMGDGDGGDGDGRPCEE